MAWHVTSGCSFLYGSFLLGSEAVHSNCGREKTFSPFDPYHEGLQRSFHGVGIPRTNGKSRVTKEWTLDLCLVNKGKRSTFIGGRGEFIVEPAPPIGCPNGG